MPFQRALRTVLIAVVLATPAAAASLTIRDIAGPADAPVRLTLPELDIADTGSDEASIRAIFSDPAGLGAATLAGLSASAIRLPELRLDLAIPAASDTATDPSPELTLTFRDLVFTDVKEGRAARLDLGGITLEAAGNPVFRLNASRIDGLDFAGILGLYRIIPAPASVMHRLYDGMMLGSGTISAPNLACSFGSSEVGASEARPLTASFSDIAALGAAGSDGASLTPEQVQKVIAMYLDGLTAYRIGASRFGDLKCTITADGQTSTLATGPIRIGAVEPGIYPEFQVDGVSLKAPDGAIKLDNFVWKRIDFTGPIAALRSAGTLDPVWLSANWRRLIPDIAGLSLGGLDVDVPDAQQPGSRVRLGAAGFDVSLADYREGLPGHMSIALDGVSVPITPDMTDPPFAELRARGIEKLELGLGASADWNRDSGDLAVSDLRVFLNGLGGVRVSLILGNVSEALFSDNPELSQAALLRARVKSLSLELIDKGLADLLIAEGATESGQTPDAFRTGLSGMVQGIALAYLGNGEPALRAAQAIGQFLEGGMTLKVTAKARAPEGMALADFALLEADPASFGNRLDVTVAAEATGDLPMLVPAVPAPQSGAGSLEEDKLRLKTAAPAQ